MPGRRALRMGHLSIASLVCPALGCVVRSGGTLMSSGSPSDAGRGRREGRGMSANLVETTNAEFLDNLRRRLALLWGKGALHLHPNFHCAISVLGLRLALALACILSSPFLLPHAVQCNVVTNLHGVGRDDLAQASTSASQDFVRQGDASVLFLQRFTQRLIDGELVPQHTRASTCSSERPRTRRGALLHGGGAP